MSIQDRESLKKRKFGDLLAAEGKDHFYVMHLSYSRDKTHKKRLWEYASEKNRIGLNCDTVTENWATLSESERKKKTSPRWKAQFNYFCEKIGVGDYVVILNGTYAILGIAKITEPKHRFARRLKSNNESNPNRFFDHVRENVQWKKECPWPGLPLTKRLTFDGTLDRVTPKSRSPRWKVLTRIRL
jgi:hypothetical protein